MRKVIASLDLGSDSLKLIVSEVFKRRLNVISSTSVVSRGIKEGFIVNLESAKQSLEELLKRTEEKINIRIKNVVVNVPSHGLECFFYSGEIIKKPDNLVINKTDIKSAIKKGEEYFKDGNVQILTNFPVKFTLNDVDVVGSPIGKEANKLTVDSVYTTIPKSNLKQIEKLFDLVNVKIIDFTVGPIADYNQFNKTYKLDNVGAVINIGGSKTEISIFNKGVLTSSSVISFGGNLIDKDISYIFKINKEDSTYLKNNFGMANKDKSEVEEFLFKQNRDGEQIKINQYEVSEIIESRLDEMIDKIKRELNHLTKREISYIMFTGGITEIKYFNNLIEKHFDANAFIGSVNELGIRSNIYSTSAGLIKYFDNKLRSDNKKFSAITQEEEDELSGKYKKINISENSILGKLFGHFFDN